MSERDDKVTANPDGAHQNTAPARDRATLPPAAQRALREAEERRSEQTAKETALPTEINGRDGPEPTRYGDWEKNGIAVDF